MSGFSSGVKSPDVYDYASAKAYLNKTNGLDRPLPGKETRLQRRGTHAIAIIYHWTDIVTYHANGRIVLNTGGFDTKTTFAKMNAYLPHAPADPASFGSYTYRPALYRIYRKKDITHLVKFGPDDKDPWGEGCVDITFDRTVTIHPDGRLEADVTTEE